MPFCISGGTALGEGVGEILTPLPAPPAHLLVVAKPLSSADTGRIYRAYDEARMESAHSVGPVVSALRSGSIPDLASAVGNDLTPVTAGLVPEVDMPGADASSVRCARGLDERKRNGCLRDLRRRRDRRDREGYGRCSFRRRLRATLPWGGERLTRVAWHMGAQISP